MREQNTDPQNSEPVNSPPGDAPTLCHHASRSDFSRHRKLMR